MTEIRCDAVALVHVGDPNVWECSEVSEGRECLAPDDPRAHRSYISCAPTGCACSDQTAGA